MTTISITNQIKRQAHSLGFELVGITAAQAHAHLPLFDAWIGKGFAATMDYLQNRRDDRADPRRLLPSAKTMICCGLNYYGKEPRSQELQTPGHGWISRYAWGNDYHEVVLEKLRRLEAFIRTEIDSKAELKSYVDTGPILERSYAASAGLGWIGKNTMLINKEIGSYFFIGIILCNLELEQDAAPPDHCGSCQLCMESCPTEALNAYELDARRCISYLTIEHRGEIQPELSEKMGQHLVGCDICQEVCPWNRSIPTTGQAAFRPRDGLFHPRLNSLENMDEEKFQKSAIKRVKCSGLQRNINIVRNNEKRILT